MKPLSTASHPLVPLVDEVIRLKGRLDGLFGDVAPSVNLSQMELTILTAVVEATRPPTVPQIGRSLGLHRQVVQRTANRLVTATLLRTEPNPDHKLAHFLQVTEAGAAVYQAATERATRTAEAVLEALSVEACQRVAAELRAVRTTIEAYLRKPDGKR